MKNIYIALTLLLFLPQITVGSSIGEREALEKSVEALNSNRSCKNSKDCLAIPMGHRACGGPESFVIASKKNADLKKLENAVMQITQMDLDDQKNSSNDSASICSIEEAPNLVCLNRICGAAK